MQSIKGFRLVFKSATGPVLKFDHDSGNSVALPYKPEDSARFEVGERYELRGGFTAENFHRAA